MDKIDKVNMSVERAVFERMITEKGRYDVEDIFRITAEEICKKKGIPMTDDFLKGFIEASHFEHEKRKGIKN